MTGKINMNERVEPTTLMRPSRERGMALVMSLIFLLLLTILGVTAMSTNTLQEKMAGNLANLNMALQAAESGLRGGETSLNLLWVSGKPTANTTCSTGVCAAGSTQPTVDSWWNTYSLEYGGSGQQITTAVSDPRFIVEEGDFVPDSLNQSGSYSAGGGYQYYKITARGVGKTNDARAMLESTYRIHN